MPKIKSNPKNYQAITTSKFFGLNIDNELELKQGEFVDMQDFRITPDYKLEKREGYKEFVIDNSDFPNITNFYVTSKNLLAKLSTDDKEYLYVFGYEGTEGEPDEYYLHICKVDISNYKIVHASVIGIGNKVYLGEAPQNVFVKNGHLYFMFNAALIGGGTVSELYDYDGTGSTIFPTTDTFVPAIVGTVPILYKTVSPNLSNISDKVFQPINLLSYYREIHYLADGTSNKYYFIENAYSVNGVTINGTSTIAYSFTTGNNYLQFYSIPASGATVTIRYAGQQARTDQYTNSGLIFECTNSMFFGGVNDLDLFVWGNPDHPNTVYHSYAGDVGFFANTGFRTFGDETITDVTVQNTTQLVFGEKTIFYTKVATNTDVLNPIEYGKDVLIRQKGHIGNNPNNPNVNVNVQIINNNPVFISDDGTINELFVMSNRDERQIRYLSNRDMSAILRSKEITSTFDFESKKEYWIFYSENDGTETTYKALIYNYYNQTWYKFSGLKSCYTPLIIDNKLYCFGNGAENFYFSPELASDNYFVADVLYQKPIEAFALTPYMAYGKDYLLKSIQRLFITLSNNPTSDSYIKVEYFTNDNEIVQDCEFQLIAGEPPKELFQEIGANDFAYVKFKFISDRIDEVATIINYTVKIQFAGEVS